MVSLQNQPDESALAAAPNSFGVMPIVAICGVVIACSVYANLSFAVTEKVNYKYFPPFQPFYDGNSNRHLGAEYLSIAKSMVAGEGFSSPFKEQTGPTAWMPPILPTFLAGLLWISAGDINAVMAVCIFLQISVLIGTGFLVLAVARQTTVRIGALATTAFFVIVVVRDFRLWFQETHDTALVLLALDALIVGFAWRRPLQGWKSALCWGLVGGVCAMISPIVAMTWGVLSIALAIRERAWKRFGIAVLLAAITISPWLIRNYLVFGRLIPVKSNAAYELWQAQCQPKDGQLHPFDDHPFWSAGAERQEYKALGEMAFIDRKSELFWQSVQTDPLDFFDRVAARFLAATLWFAPATVQGAWMVWTRRALHSLPFLALVFLALTAFVRRLHWVQWILMGMYVLYLGPYIAISYYERYGMPLLALKVLLVIWAADRLLTFVWPGKEMASDAAPEA